MLRLTGISVHNICQFDDASYAIASGLTSVTGPNGRGKSSLLRALVYALTGIVDGEYGNQSTLQKDGTADPGWSEASFTDGQHEYKVKRFSTSDIKFYDTLTCDGATLAIRRKAVDAQLTALYGIPPSLLFQVSWCRQGRLDYMLTAPAAIINQFLQGVFDMKALEKLREKIKTASDSIAAYPASLIEYADKHKEELSNLPPTGYLDKDIEELQTSKVSLERSCADLRAKSSVGISKAAFDTQMTAMRDNLVRMDTWLQENQLGRCPDHGELSVAEIDAELVDLEKAYNNAERLILATSARVEKMGSIIDGEKARIDSKMQKLEEIRSTLSVHDVHCHLCGGDIVDHDNYERSRARLVCGEDSLEEFITKETAAIAEIEGRLAALHAEIEKENQASSRNSKIMDDSMARATMLQKERIAAEAYESWLNLSSRIEEITSARETALLDMEKFSKTPVYPDDIDQRLRQDEEALSAVANRLESLVTERAEVEASRVRLTETVDMESDIATKAKVNTDARDTLAELREVFSQQRTQAIYLRSRITSLNQRIARFMTAIQMPFSLELDPETHVFMQTTQEGYTHPASHLSGAQKSMAACVLQMAIMSVVQPNMNLFLLDEPGESLDEQNKIVMADLFARMARMMPSMDGVMLIVTRDRHLIEACGNNIDIGAKDADNIGGLMH